MMKKLSATKQKKKVVSKKTVSAVAEKVIEPIQHSEQIKLINTKLPATEDDKRIAVPFDVAHPLDVLNHDYYLPEHIKTAEEKEFIAYYVKMLSNRLLIDVLELMTKGIEFLDATREYKYSRERCSVYYELILLVIRLLKEVEGSTNVVFYRMFQIPFNPRNHYKEVPFEEYSTLIPDTTGKHDEVKAEKDPKRRETMIKYPYILEDAWRAFINKVVHINEEFEVGLRLSLEYTLAHYPFCDSECCLLPEDLSDIREFTYGI